MTGQKEDGNGTATKKKYIIIPKQPDGTVMTEGCADIQSHCSCARHGGS